MYDMLSGSACTQSTSRVSIHGLPFRGRPGFLASRIPCNENAVVPGEKRELVIDNCSSNETPGSDRSTFKWLLLVTVVS